MNVSQRITNMGEPALLKYYPLVDKVQAEGKKVYFLNIGQPDIITPPAFMDKIAETESSVLAYEAPEGIVDLRRAASAYYRRYDLHYQEDEMLVTNGGSEALMFTFLTICNPGEEILTPEPLYSIYKEMAAASSVCLKGIKTYAEEGFALPDAQTIEAQITPKTQAILITNPGNPTGKVYTREEIERIRDLAIKHQLYVITDEVYREFVYDGLQYVSPGHYPELDAHCIVIDSISKRYSACGARIGFILSKNQDFLYQARKLCQMRLAVSSVDQQGAAELFKLPEDFFDMVLKEYTHRRDIVYDYLSKMPDVICKKPTGAFYYVVKLPVIDACQFIEWMITDFDDNGKTVLLSPANDFYLHPEDGRDEVRLAYVLKDTDMIDAMKTLQKGLETYRAQYPERFK